MKNKTELFSQKISFWSGIIIFGLLIGLSLQLVRAWTEPTVAPPGGNVGAPLNTSNIGQQKEGGLIINTGGAEVGFIVDKGNVGIGTPVPKQKVGETGFIDVADVWIRDANGGSGAWASAISATPVYKISCMEDSVNLTTVCVRMKTSDGSTEILKSPSWYLISWARGVTVPPFSATSPGLYDLECNDGAPQGQLPYCCRINSVDGSAECKTANNWALTGWTTRAPLPVSW